MLRPSDIPPPTLSPNKQIELLLSRYDCREGDSCTGIDCPLCELRQSYEQALGQMEDALSSFILSAKSDENIKNALP
jgi:hypothetical protein